MELTVWGARGSHSASGGAFSVFGHHTACLSVAAGDDLIVLDAGSGAAALGVRLAGRSPRRVHILLSHFHHDHIMGLPFLLFGLDPRAEITLHCALGADVPIADHLARLFSAPYFPADAAALFGRVRLRAHAAGAGFRAGGAVVRTCLLDHPGGSAAFRLDDGARTLVYASDLEDNPTPPPELVALASGVDLLIHDTMFTAEEIAVRRGWGHATAEAAIALAEAASCRKLAGFHHNPAHDDAVLAGRETVLAARLPGAVLLREGQVVTV
jgi:ribonuclease BN (tRNA processing enzyme)